MLVEWALLIYNINFHRRGLCGFLCSVVDPTRIRVTCMPRNLSCRDSVRRDSWSRCFHGSCPSTHRNQHPQECKLWKQNMFSSERCIKSIKHCFQSNPSALSTGNLFIFTKDQDLLYDGGSMCTYRRTEKHISGWFILFFNIISFLLDTRDRK